MNATPFAGSSGGAVVLHMDITAHKAQEAKIHRLSHHDELTGAANRRHFYEAAQEVLGRAGAGSFRCSTSTWTTSRASTTATVMPAATRSSSS